MRKDKKYTKNIIHKERIIFFVFRKRIVYYEDYNEKIKRI